MTSRAPIIDPEAIHHGVRCPACRALMSPATTTLDWWDCINPFCTSGEQPRFTKESA